MMSTQSFNVVRRVTAACFLLVMLLYARRVFATTQHEKLWTGFHVMRSLDNENKWKYLFFTQFRFIDQSHPWQVYLLEGGLGYEALRDFSVWMGYRWSAHNPNNGFSQSNRMWQQILWDLERSETARFQSRLRLEEIVQGQQSQPSFRLRERIYWELRHRYLTVFNPLMYEEMFFQLNKTDYTTHQFISENRVFIGFNLIRSHNAFWEIGYINQYEFSTPLTKQNAMNHVLSLNYNIV